MNLVTDLGLISGAYELEQRLRAGSLATPVRLIDGSSLFVWVGKADSVELVTWMPSFPAPPPFTRLAGSEVWVLTLRLPATALIEYRIGIGRGDRRHEVLDPLNPNATTNPFGSNSVATGAGYRLPGWARARPEVDAGQVGEIRVRSSVWGERRHHLLYSPPGHGAPPPSRLVIVHDGADFAHHSRLATVLDNLIAAGAIPPVAVLLHQPRARLTEYADDPRHAAHVVDELIPHVAGRTGVDPGRPVLVGSSLGAVAALSVGIRRPDEVGPLILISGSFARRLSEERPAEVFDPVVKLVGRVDDAIQLADRRIYMSCGRYEGLIDLNRALVPRLRAAGARVHYEETWDGHQWASWRDRLGPALEYALG